MAHDGVADLAAVVLVQAVEQGRVGGGVVAVELDGKVLAAGSGLNADALDHARAFRIPHQHDVPGVADVDVVPVHQHNVAGGEQGQHGS